MFSLADNEDNTDPRLLMDAECFFSLVSVQLTVFVTSLWSMLLSFEMVG